MVGGVSAAHGQTNLGPAAIERTIPGQLSPAHTAPSITPPSRIGVAEPTVTGRFTLGAVHIERATAFSRTELSRDFEPHLASEVDESKLRDIAASITRR